MKIIVLVISFLSVTGIALSQSECDEFKTGKFQNLENGIVKTDIERNDSIQIEQYGEKIIKLKIEWIDTCSYRLIFLEGNDAWYNSVGREKPTPDLIVRITDIQDDSYLQEAKFAGDDTFKYKSKMKKVE